MGAKDIYLFGEEHDNHAYRMAELSYIKRLSDEKLIHCLSLELPMNEYQHLLDTFDVEEHRWQFGVYTPIIYLAKKRGLDIIASDYRDTLAGYVLEILRNKDSISDADDNLKEEQLKTFLEPLIYREQAINREMEKENPYSGFSERLAKAKDIFDFFATEHYEERERFMVNRLNSYLQARQGKSVLHISGSDHIESLERKLISAGRSVEVIKILSLH